MIRKLTLFLLTACMLLTLAACGGNAEDEGSSQSDSKSLQSAQSQGTSSQEDGDASDGDLQPIALQGGDRSGECGSCAAGRQAGGQNRPG